jgi:hypothetical protein
VAWEHTSSPPFVARHPSGEREGAQRILATLAAARERVDAVLDVSLDEVTVVIHERELLLVLAHPVLPLVRRLSAPAARRYVAGWAAAGEIHVLAPRLLERRASSVPGSRRLLALVPAALYARLAVGAANARLPPPFTPGATVRYARWAWLVEGAAQWLSGQTPHARAAVARRLHEGPAPSFPPGLADATLLGGSVLELLAREEGPAAVARLIARLHPEGARGALQAAFQGRALAHTEAAWRASLRR